MTIYGNQNLQGELNRLANGGASYPSREMYREAQAAANAWAGTTGHSLLLALNVKAGNSASTYRDLNAVCNQLAGTTGFDAQGALQQKAS